MKSLLPSCWNVPPPWHHLKWMIQISYLSNFSLCCFIEIIWSKKFLKPQAWLEFHTNMNSGASYFNLLNCSRAAGTLWHPAVVMPRCEKCLWRSTLRLFALQPMVQLQGCAIDRNSHTSKPGLMAARAILYELPWDRAETSVWQE